MLLYFRYICQSDHLALTFYNQTTMCQFFELPALGIQHSHREALWRFWQGGCVLVGRTYTHFIGVVRQLQLKARDCKPPTSPQHWTHSLPCFGSLPSQDLLMVWTSPKLKHFYFLENISFQNPVICINCSLATMFVVNPVKYVYALQFTNISTHLIF